MWFATLHFGAGMAAGQTDTAADVRRGHVVAIESCALCHVAARDQPTPPILRPPAPSFDSIAQRENTSAESLATFLRTTHSGLDNPNGMSNPRLFDYEIRQTVAYILSLRKNR